MFAGTPEFAARALDALIHSQHDVVGVLSQPDRPAGRGRKLTASPVKALALANGLPVQQPSSLRDADAVAALRDLHPDVLVVAAYGLLLPQDVLDLPPLGCLNIHASLLPRWRGAAPIHRAILAGDRETGIAIMQMDAGLDTGAVLLERRVPIASSDTTASLHETLAALGAEAIVEAIGGRCREDLQPHAQPQEGVTYASKLDKGEALLDFSNSAIELDRQIRGLNPWPVAETSLDGKRVRVWRAECTDGDSDAPPGTLLNIVADSVEVATGEGRLLLHEIQRDGGKRVSAGAVIRSLDAVGHRFGV